jgi:hypothetical protein
MAAEECKEAHRIESLLAEQAPHDFLVLSVDASGLPLLVDVVEGALLVRAVRGAPNPGLIHVQL